MASILILLAMHIYNLQMNIYVCNHHLFYPSKYRQVLRNEPQIKLIGITEQKRKRRIIKAFGILNTGLIYTNVITLCSQAHLKPLYVVATVYLYIFLL
jgi:hypothetical protein